jgi:hypothetical protein
MITNNPKRKQTMLVNVKIIPVTQHWAAHLQGKWSNSTMGKIKEFLDFVNRLSWKKSALRHSPLDLLLVKNPRFHQLMGNVNLDITPVINISFAPHLKAYYFYTNLFKLPFTGLRRPGALFEKTAPGPRKNFLFMHDAFTTSDARLLNKTTHETRKNFLLKGIGDFNHEHVHRKNYPFPGFSGRFPMTANAAALGSIINRIFTYANPGDISRYTYTYWRNQVMQHIYKRLITHVSSLQNAAFLSLRQGMQHDDFDVSPGESSLKPVLNSIYTQDYVKVESLRHGRPQRVAPTDFRRGRSPYLPENLAFWATLRHPRIYTMNRLMGNIFKSTTSGSHPSPLSHLSPPPLVHHLSHVSLVLQNLGFNGNSSFALGSTSILSRIFTYADTGNTPGYTYKYPGNRFIQNIYKRILILFSTLRNSTDLLPKKEDHSPGRKPGASVIHIQPLGKSTPRTHRVSSDTNRHRYSPQYAAGLPPTPLEMVTKKVKKIEQINLEEVEKIIYQKVSKQVEQTVHQWIDRRLAAGSRDTQQLTENIYSQLVSRIVLEKERVI